MSDDAIKVEMLTDEQSRLIAEAKAVANEVVGRGAGKSKKKNPMLIAYHPDGSRKKSRGRTFVPHRKHVPKVAKKRGRPPHVPTDLSRRQVLMCCSMGMTYPQIGRFLDISDETLAKYYKDELQRGITELNINVVNNLYTIATSTDHKSAAAVGMFWAKARLGWKETSRTEMTGADGQPLGAEGPKTLDARLLTAEQRDQLRQIILSARAAEAKEEARKGPLAPDDVDEVEDGDDEVDEGA